MSKVFYDHLLDLGELGDLVKRRVKNPKKREEIYTMIDEIVHHRVLGCILDKLPQNHHGEFLEEVKNRPHDEGLFAYLKEKLKTDFEEFVKKELKILAVELLTLLQESIEPRPKKLKAS